MTDSDSLYHRLFSHPLMIEGLVREFVPEVLAAGVDFARMERVPAKFHSRTGRRRESDVIWRLPTALGVDVYLYLLLEFQSQIDWWMAVRIQVYVGLLWQQLIDERTLKPGDRLPPILPIVLYNADPRWQAPTASHDLIALPAESSLWPWQPQVRYHLLDEGAFAGADLARRDSLVALLFRLEHYRGEDELIALIDEAVGWFRQHRDYDRLKHLFTELIRQAVANLKGQDVAVPEDMMEIRNMMAQRSKELREQWIAEGVAKGMAQGVVQGMAQGVVQGMAQGVVQGMALGRAEVVLRLLVRRFGPLPPGIEDRVRTADARLLDEWTDRVLDAPTLTDVFLADRPN